MTQIKIKQPFTSKVQGKEVVEHQITPSDRIELIQQTNSFIDAMVRKSTFHFFSDKIDVQALEMSRQETETYNSGLLFLKRQFDIGYKETEINSTRREKESNTEYQIVEDEDQEGD